MKKLDILSIDNYRAWIVKKKGVSQQYFRLWMTLKSGRLVFDTLYFQISLYSKKFFNFDNSHFVGQSSNSSRSHYKNYYSSLLCTQKKRVTVSCRHILQECVNCLDMINYFFLKISQIAKRFGNIFKMGNVLCVENNQ